MLTFINIFWSSWIYSHFELQVNRDLYYFLVLPPFVVCFTIQFLKQKFNCFPPLYRQSLISAFEPFSSLSDRKNWLATPYIFLTHNGVNDSETLLGIVVCNILISVYEYNHWHKLIYYLKYTFCVSHTLGKLHYTRVS